MNGKINLEIFQYFLECYFNVSANYDEIDNLIDKFNLDEGQNYRQKLLDELNIVLQLENWAYIQEFVKNYGMRKMNEEKLKWLINRILNKLQSS